MNSITTQQHYSGFDYLRAVMSVSIIAWHTGLVLGNTKVFGYDLWNIDIIFSDIMNFNFQLLAVPIFYLIALFLTVKKLMVKPTYYRERLRRLVYLYIFWSLMWILYNHGIHWFGKLLSYDYKSIIRVLLGSDFGVFYFINFLILLSAISKYVYKLPYKYLKLMIVYSILFIALFPCIVLVTKKLFILVNYLNPLNYLPYLLIATVVAKSYTENAEYFYKKLKNYIIYLSIAYLLSTIYEWQYLVHVNFWIANGYALPPYARLSVVFGSTLLFLLSFYIKKPSVFIIKFLSDHSLALYCLHPFMMVLFRDYIPCRLCFFTYVLMSSILLTMLIKKKGATF
ncbi:MAG: acyltransferase [Candidatus Magnetoovum sp. WYHC-5]|nr:acyltransferase [Candidatus Magnetoovum sp. WYHC-5]